MYQQGYRPPPKAAGRPAKKPPKAAPGPASGGRAPMRPAMNGYAFAPGGVLVRPPKRRSGLGKFLFLAILLGAVAFGAFYLKTWLEVRPYDTLFAPNVYVDGIPLAGMTAAEGVQAVWQNAQNKLGALSIRLMAGDQVYATIQSDMLGLTFDADLALNQAFAVGHNGTVFDRKREIDEASAEGKYFASLTPDADTSQVDSLLLKLKNDLYRAPADATFSFNPDASDPFTFVSEVMGMSLDIEPLRQQIYTMVENMQSGDITITPTYTQPTVTVDALKQNLTLMFRATTPIDSKSTKDRTNNIRRAFEEINGTVLTPGKKFSFNNVVGWRTEKNGFFPAPEYAYGELETGIGGGVCQASTTVYLAAIQSGLQIVDRSPHSDPVSYTAFGKDATVYMASNRKIDLVFTNSTASNIYITAAVKTDPANRKRFYCEVCIYGPSLGDVSYELEAKETSLIKAPKEPEIIKDKQHKYTDELGEEYTAIKARDGHVVVSELITKVNGVETDRTFVAEDTYKARAARVYVGVD